MKKTKIGLIEKVEISKKEYLARIDTGAEISSIDKNLVKKLNLKHINKKMTIKSANGNSIRKLIVAIVKIKNRKLKAKFTVADRSKMKNKILIGRNILKKGFIIDCSN